ncbi:glycine cleavage system protein H, partial [Candidatus Aerophobetes bacterium]|nr:glycine cleavage system protein H [Candidatus Aerophobetes bacterium]
MYPDDLRYLDYHGWVKVEGEVGKIGVTYFGQEKMGEIIYVELPAKGKELKQKDKLCTLESAKSVFDFPSPLSGTVIEVNEKLNQEPSLI